MRKMILMLAVIMAGISAGAAESSKNGKIQFVELPFSEGTLYVSVSSAEETIHKSAVEVESDTVSLPIDLSKWDGKRVEVKAFQDLNDNRTLDFDSYGRPQEPCLQTTATVDANNPVLEFKLIQY